MPDGVLVTYWPTWAQSVGRGIMLGLLLALAAVGGVLLRVGALPDRVDVALVLAAFVLGLVLGTLFSRRVAVHVSETGLRPVGTTRSRRRSALWAQVDDVRAERRRGRTAVTVHLETGRSLRLPAPYHGLLLARDPEFEEKVFTLRNIWETYRTWVPDTDHDGGITAAS